MGQSKKKGNRRRREEEEEEEVPGISKWSELYPDLLRCVFKRLSLTSFNRAKSVCSSWHSASRGCVPKQNQIPWLILFPPKEKSNNSSSCVLFVPEDQDKVYRSIDLGVEFAQSRCLTTCGSWLLMFNTRLDLYILNPLTGERFDLPDTKYFRGYKKCDDRACFWIDNKTKDYLVVMIDSSLFTKKGYKKWRSFHRGWCGSDMFYNHKDQELHVLYPNGLAFVDIWDFSGDKPRKDGSVSLPCFKFSPYDFPSFLNEKDDKPYWKRRDFEMRTAVTVSGDILMVLSIVQHCKTWYFCIYKTNQVDGKWVKIDSLGDEALIYDLDITVIANGIPGIKRNSIYFSGVDHGIGRDVPHHIFIYDLTTQKMEPLPQCVLSSIPFSDARWFVPC